MIKYIECYVLVNEFKFISGSLFLLTQSEIISKETSKNLKGEFYCIRSWKNFLLTQNKNENNILFLDKDLNIRKEISGSSNYALWLLNACGLIPVEDKVLELTDSLDLNETKITIFPKDCIKNNGIRRAKNSVLCDDLNSSHLKWKFELGENIKVGGDFILMDELAIVSTNNQDLIGIDIESGMELWRLPNCNLYHQKQLNTNYLVGLSSNSFGDNFYQVIDPVSGAKLIDKKFENFFYETSPTLASITETHYYFISNELGYPSEMRTERITHLGCVNLQTHEIEWVEKIGTIPSSRGNGYLKPEINNNKIYLLDGEKTLHIYEL